MAKKSMILKQQKEPKFSSRAKADQTLLFKLTFSGGGERTLIASLNCLYYIPLPPENPPF